jgi:hypothetical protein
LGPNEIQDLVPRLIINKDAISNTFGLKGDLGDWNYEVAYSRYTQSLLEQDQYNADQAKVQAAVDAGKFNLFGYWTNSFDLTKSVLMDQRVRTTYQSPVICTLPSVPSAGRHSTMRIMTRVGGPAVLSGMWKARHWDTPKESGQLKVISPSCNYRPGGQRMAAAW